MSLSKSINQHNAAEKRQRQRAMLREAMGFSYTRSPWPSDVKLFTLSTDARLARDRWKYIRFHIEGYVYKAKSQWADMGCGMWQRMWFFDDGKRVLNTHYYECIGPIGASFGTMVDGRFCVLPELEKQR
jgi:hypothetical protein